MKKLNNYIILIFVWLFTITITNGQIPDGGTDLIRDAISYYSKIGKGTSSIQTISDQPFEKAFRYVTPADVISPWDAQIIFQPIAGIAQNDILLVTFFARTIASSQETGEAWVTVVIENKTTYEKVVSHNITVGSEWKQYYAPAKSNVTLATAGLNCSFFFGFPSQTVEVAGIRYLNYTNTKTLEEMPETEISYSGREPDAPWRAEAQERIEQYRKGNIQITVVDTFGNPVPDAEVRIGMTRQQFSIGSAIVASEYAVNPVYKSVIHELFNEVVFENDLKWGSFNSKSLAQKNQMLQVIDELKTHNINMRGHNIIWPSWKFLPVYLANYDTDEARLRLEIDKHIDEISTFTRNRVVDWDVINEPFSEHDLMDILGREAMADWFKRVRNNDPYAKLYLNEYAILSSSGINYPKQDFYIETCRFIDENGGGVQGIGLQGHFSSDLTPITRLKTVLDKFSVLEKDIKITEFDIAIGQDSVKADYTRDFMTMVFSHPSVKGILLWGFWEGRHWKADAAMYALDWTLKPNGKAFKDLVLNEWWTKDTTIISDASGIVNLNGFLGSYSYIVSSNGQESSGSLTVDLPVSSQISNEFQISIDPLVPAELMIDVDGETIMCEGESSQLSVNLPIGFSIKWYKDESDLQEVNSAITVNSSGTYYAEATGKGMILKTDPVEIIVNNIPEATLEVSGDLSFCPGGSVTLTANEESQFTYKWFRNGVFFSGSLPQLTVGESGTYKVEVNSLGCKSVSEEVIVTKLQPDDPSCTIGIKSNGIGLSVSPNPFVNSFMFDASGLTGSVEISMIDLHGKVIYQTIISNSSIAEVQPDVPNGFYILKVQSRDEVRWMNLVRQQ